MDSLLKNVLNSTWKMLCVQIIYFYHLTTLFRDLLLVKLFNDFNDLQVSNILNNKQFKMINNNFI